MVKFRRVFTGSAVVFGEEGVFGFSGSGLFGFSCFTCFSGLFGAIFVFFRYFFLSFSGFPRFSEFPEYAMLFSPAVGPLFLAVVALFYLLWVLR